MMHDDLWTMLQEGGYTLVVKSTGGEITTSMERGVRPLFTLLRRSPALLLRASLADKVVGKGAAAMMVVGGVKQVRTGIISRPALQMLLAHGVEVQYEEEVDGIVNRSRTDFCPVEKLCASAPTAEACLPLIEEFIRSNNRPKTE